jgi:inositol phosphorylceramide mannosyltransferase catalytic subunit
LLDIRVHLLTRSHLATDTVIPPVLHQTWKSCVFPEPIDYSQSWRRLNPNMRYQFFDDRACREFVGETFPHYLSVYDGFPFAIERADFFRYLTVYHFGGIYADVDMECLQPFDRFLSLNGIVFSIEAHLTPQRQRELAYRCPVQIANCIFAAEPHHPFLLKLIERIVELAASHSSQTLNEVEDFTGPRLLTRLFYESLPTGVAVMKQIYWMAPSYYGRWLGLNVNVFACHHFLGSWKAVGGKPSLSRRLIERNRPPWPFPRKMFHQFA